MLFRRTSMSVGRCSCRSTGEPSTWPSTTGTSPPSARFSRRRSAVFQSLFRDRASWSSRRAWPTCPASNGGARDHDRSVIVRAALSALHVLISPLGSAPSSRAWRIGASPLLCYYGRERRYIYSTPTPLPTPLPSLL